MPSKSVLPGNTLTQSAIDVSTVAAMIAGAAFIAICMLYFSYQTVFAGFNWDDAFYLLMADLYSPFHPMRSPVLLKMVGMRNYPPLYPLFLSLFGAGTTAIGNAQIANTAAILLGLGALFLWQRQLGFSTVAAYATTLTVALSPMVLQLFQSLWSEHLYAALTLLAVLLTSRGSDKPGSWLLAACCVALASITRTVGTTLVLVFVLHALIRKHPRRGLVIAVATLPLVIERSFNHILSRSGYSYSDYFVNKLSSLFDFHWLSGQVVEFYTAWTAGIAFDGTGLPSAVAALVLIAAAGGLLLRLVKMQLDAMYVAVYLVVVLAWPFPGQAFRFLMPVFPFLLTYAVWSTGTLAASVLRRINQDRLVAATGSFMFLVVAVPSIHYAADRLSEPAPPNLEPYTHTSIWLGADNVTDAALIAKARSVFVADMKVIGKVVPPDQCVYSELPAIIMLYAHRLALPSPWPDIENIPGTSLACHYYYMVPPALRPAPSPAGFDRFRANYRILHVSISPRDPGGREKLGILADLR